MPADLEGVAEEANRLYWHTDMPVAEISATLDLSRRALYDAIEPLPADTICGICGSIQTFANRSARSSGTVRCATCNGETEAATGAAATAGASQAGPQEPASPPAGRLPLGVPSAVRRFAGSSVAGEETDGRVLLITTAALVGAALGAAATFALFRRR